MNGTKSGSERLKGAIRRNAIKWFIIALLILLCGVALLIVGISASGDEDGVAPLVMGGFFGLAGLIIVLMNLKNMISPEKGKFAKRNPRIFEMADEHYADIKYQDKIVTISDKYISCTKQPWTLCKLEDVYQVYYKVTRYMIIITLEKMLMFRCGPMDFGVNVLGKSQKKIDACISNVSRSCPNARFGFTKENNSYADQMKAQWKAD